MAAEGGEEPKREVKRSPKEILPPIVETTDALSPAPNPNTWTLESRWGRWYQPVYPPVAAENPMTEYLENLARERLVWGVAVAVSWTITVAAVLRLAGVIL